MPWCRFFIPKMASPKIRPEDPDLNEHIMYAKCIKGHVLKDAGDWILCENLPAPDAQCWQEGGQTLFSLTPRKRDIANEIEKNGSQQSQAGTTKKSQGAARSQKSRT